MNRRVWWAFVWAAIAVACGVLSFHRATDAAPRGDLQPFANSVEQRMETINELREIHALMKEQNALLKEQISLWQSGQVKVVLSRAETPAEHPAEGDK
jgi:hypothetical protein